MHTVMELNEEADKRCVYCTNSINIFQFELDNIYRVIRDISENIGGMWTTGKHSSNQQNPAQIKWIDGVLALQTNLENIYVGYVFFPLSALIAICVTTNTVRFLFKQHN